MKLIVLSALAMATVMACGAADSKPAESGTLPRTIETASVYPGMLLLCVDFAQVKSESQKCRCRVNHLFALKCNPDPYADGGADVSDSGKDGD